jgi:hypothetical protein
MSINKGVTPELWESHVKLIFDQLNEKHRRWLAGLLSEMMGHGGIQRMSSLVGIDPKTIRQGRIELRKGLKECPTNRVRRDGAGRPPLKKNSNA